MDQENTNYRVVQTISTPPENKTRTLLIIGIAIIVLFVAGEAGYYFYNKQMLDKQQQTQEETNEESIFAVDQIVDKSSSIIDQINVSAGSGLLKQANIERVIAGTVEEISASSVVLDNYVGKTAIVIRGVEGKSMRIHFSESEIQKMKINQTNPDGTPQQVNIEEINVGDYINIYIKDNLLNPNLDSVVTISITRSQQ